MTQPYNEMPDNPGSPDATDEANYSPDQAEAAAAEAAAADSAGAEDDLVTADDTTVADAVDEELEELLSDDSADAAVNEVYAAAEADAAADVESEESDLHAKYEATVAELTNDLKRIGAEFANYRRRMDRERQAAITSAKARVFAELLPVLDDLDLAKQHGHVEDGPLKAFADKLHGILDGLGLERFGATGDEFNPDIHEAIQDNSSGDAKVLGTVLRPGYRYDSATVRNAMVIIDDPTEDDSTPDGD